MGSPENDPSNKQGRYVTCECCFLFTFLDLTFGFLTIFLRLRVCLINCQWTSQKFFENLCSVSSTSLC